MVKEKYLIGEREYKLSSDQNWDEIEQLEDLFYRLKASDGGTVNIEGSFTREEIIKALFLILEPADGMPKDINDFKKATPDLSVQIIADFFFFIALRNIIISKTLQMYRNA